MDKRRILALNKHSVETGKVVVYVMARDQRVKDNHALLAAQEYALARELPLVVVFNLSASVGVRAREHYQFMVDGLQQVERDLQVKKIGFIVTIGAPRDILPALFIKLGAAAIYFDFSPLRGPRSLQKFIATQARVPCFVVDTHNIIPVWVVSPKQEFAAHTMRSKVHKMLAEWLVAPDDLQRHEYSIDIAGISVSWAEVAATIDSVPSNGSHLNFSAGEVVAHNVLKDFLQSKLKDYAANRNIPTLDATSNFSPYLHFGQISSLRIALEIVAIADEIPLLFERAKLASYEGTPSKMDSINSMLEEMIVRKELADNYCFYTSQYDSLEGAWQWAKDSLARHADDVRSPNYELAELEAAKTHDAAWNAAQKQLTGTGKMHGYMRMYWAKKILEWAPSPEVAIAWCIYLNDHYSIDGGDPSGYVGIMWSIAGVHDRPWFDRPIFGKIRYMNDAGLARKFDVSAYIAQWSE